VIRASGCIILSLDSGRICLQLRSENAKYGGTWSFWGGKQEQNEKPVETLLRELKEEIGLIPDIEKVYPLHRYVSRDKNFEYNAFVVTVYEEFIPNLNHESNGYAWVNIGCYPKPLHKGAKNVLLNASINKKIEAIFQNKKESNGIDWVSEFKIKI
jgi:ADP-ribose pyrophosphatase YjhB (NUDIX family)